MPWHFGSPCHRPAVGPCNRRGKWKCSHNEPLRPCEAPLCLHRSTCLNRLLSAIGVAQHMTGGGAEVDDTAAQELEVDISTRERVDKNKQGGGGDGLCVVDQAIPRCPTLNPRLRCSAPAPAPPPPSFTPTCDGRLPLTKRYHPSFVIANARASGLITLAGAGQAPGAAGWNPAAPGELRDQISAQPGTGTTAGMGQRQAASLRLPNTTFRAAQTRQRRKPLLGPATASRCHWLPSAWTDRHLVGLLWFGDPLRWQGCPHCQGPSSCRTPTPGGPSSESWRFCPTVPWKCSSLPREFVLILRIIHLVGCSASRVCLHRLFPAVSRGRSSFVSRHLVREVPGQTGGKRSSSHPPSTQAGTSRPGEVARQLASACSAKISAPLVIYAVRSRHPGGFHSHTPKPGALYPPAGTAACRLYVCSFLSPFKLSHARCRLRRSFIGPRPLSLAWSPLTTVISGSKEP